MLIVQFVKLRRAGVRKNPFLWVVAPIGGLIVLTIPVYGDLHLHRIGAFAALPILTIGLMAPGIIFVVVLGIVRPDRTVAS